MVSAGFVKSRVAIHLLHKHNHFRAVDDKLLLRGKLSTSHVDLVTI